MAIYHFSAQIISRGKGQSAVASASYRSGEKLEDERTGETKFYKREVQPETMILAPNHAPDWVHDRNRLWNEVEKIEKNHNSQLAREINIALPKEFSNDQQRELIRDFSQKEFVDKGMVADIAIHRDDKENPHAHVMLTVRKFEENGEWGNKKRKDYILDDNGEKVLDRKGKPKFETISLTDWDQTKTLENWREQWANHANKELEKIGVERISHLSHEDRGLEQLPTIHLGHVAHAMEKNDKKSDRGNINRDIQEYNNNIIDLQKYREEKEALLQQQQANKKEESILTVDEKIAIKEAEKGLGEKVSLSIINEQKKELAEWSKQVENNSSHLFEKERILGKAKQELTFIKSIETRIKDQQELKENAGLLEFKVKKNADLKIASLESDLEFRNQQLKPILRELGLDNKESLVFELKKFEKIRTEQHEILREERKEINRQTKILDKAEHAIKQGEIREITSHYPELKNASEFMKYENAMKLKEINEKSGKIVPLDQIKSEIDVRTEKIDNTSQVLKQIKKEQQKSATAQVYFNKLHAVEQKIEKIENNPFLKGKMRFSQEAKNEYEQEKSTREQYKSALKGIGFTDEKSFDKYKEQLIKLEEMKPNFEKRIQNYQEGNYKGQNGISLELLEGAMQGVEQAKNREERETKKQREKQLYRGQKQHEGHER